MIRLTFSFALVIVLIACGSPEERKVAPPLVPMPTLPLHLPP
jgi:hypothetical protein